MHEVALAFIKLLSDNAGGIGFIIFVLGLAFIFGKYGG